ncbi:TetR/AcrR family transcriptional regulator [Streptomyces qinzhouensis]|uniref:TetR/AcrR family transcriptional regulator n=1 Tax=Streptomyces qinzhouensis TaxID=2599401 RepID=A0A5B8J821_9ACTN|nr:TetR/AcrR family transcriptional regulator [Streptomyces qinzhouensis]QDY77416.1 TetR/AcrR family transcriptional regulator [Streptomyces qinzhouensis]
MTTETTGSGDIARTLELMWGLGEKPTRGPKPGLTLDAIVSKAIEVADTEGLAAASMRRIANELGTGTMSLYRYVPGKAELLDLMLDKVCDPGDPCATDGETPDWRPALADMARGFLELHQRHPWLLRINQARTVLGPSTISSLEAALAVLRGMSLTDTEKISVIISVQSLAAGVARMAADAEEAVEQTGLSHADFWSAQEPFLAGAMHSGKFPLVAGLGEDTFTQEFDHLDFGVQRLIAGLDALVREREASGWRNPSAGRCDATDDSP